MAKWNKRVVSTIIDRMRVTRVAGVVGKTIVRVDSSLSPPPPPWGHPGLSRHR